MKKINLRSIILILGLITSLKISAQTPVQGLTWEQLNELYPNFTGNLGGYGNNGDINSLLKAEVGTNAYAEACFKRSSVWHLGGDNLYPNVNPTYQGGILGTINALLGQNQFNIGTCNKESFILKANNLERIFITPDGNVGIGPNNSAPSAPLDVSDGTGHLKIYGNNNGTIESNGAITLNHTGFFYVKQQGTTVFGTDPTNGFYINDVDFHLFNSTYGSTFNINGSNGYTEIKVHSPLGMPVPSGATAPRVFTIRDMASSKDLFAVTSSGKAYAREVEISLQSTFPDYVFDKGYTLKPLNEVADFIAQNKHLPGFEKGEFYERNGINVTDLFIKQQEKIEELTLYIIELEKRGQKIAELEQRLKTLELAK